jgi:hypothetical protein
VPDEVFDMKRSILALGVVLLVAGLMAAGERTVSAQNGTFSAAQAERGMTAGMENCGSCHGMDLMGGDFAPGIVGGAFIGRWDGETLDTLVTKVTQTMPLDRPGQLDSGMYSDIMAYILQGSGFTAGDAEFDVDAAGNADVTITAP